MRDKNKALQITTPFINAAGAPGLALRPTGKCVLIKANAAHLGSYSLSAERKGCFGTGNAMHDSGSGYPHY